MKKLLLSLCAGALALGASAQEFPMGQAFAYDFTPDFAWDLYEGELYAQYPAEGMRGQAVLESNLGYTSAWFNNRHSYTSAEEMLADWPCVEDPANPGCYALRMMTDRWDGFGNFNFALPEINKLCRVRVIYHVDQTAAENTWYTGEDQKPFDVKIMNDADQDTYDYPQTTEYNTTYWENPGFRVADFYLELGSDEYYVSLLWDAGGLSCQRKVPMYVAEVSVVPVELLEGDTHVAGDQELAVVKEMPELVAINGDVDAISEISSENNAEAVFYNLNGVKVNRAGLTPGVYVERRGTESKKVVIR